MRVEGYSPFVRFVLKPTSYKNKTLRFPAVLGSAALALSTIGFLHLGLLLSIRTKKRKAKKIGSSATHPKATFVFTKTHPQQKNDVISAKAKFQPAPLTVNQNSNQLEAPTQLAIQPDAKPISTMAKLPIAPTIQSSISPTTAIFPPLEAPTQIAIQPDAKPVSTMAKLPIAPTIQPSMSPTTAIFPPSPIHIQSGKTQPSPSSIPILQTPSSPLVNQSQPEPEPEPTPPPLKQDLEALTIEDLTAKADAGNAAAQTLLASYHWKGIHGATASLPLANYYLQMAVAQEDPKGLLEFGKFIILGLADPIQTFEEGFEFIRKAVSTGNSAIQCAAYLFFNSLQLNRKGDSYSKEAQSWLESSAAQGDPDARTIDFFLRHESLLRNGQIDEVEKEIHQIEAMANAGGKYAAEVIGTLYLLNLECNDKIIVAQDLQKAVHYLNLAAKSGLPDAYFWLSELHSDPVNGDFCSGDLARQYLQESIKRGSEEGLFKKADRYHKRLTLSPVTYERAAQCGSLEGIQQAAAFFASTAQFDPTAKEKAKHYYTLLLNFGDPLAMDRLKELDVDTQEAAAAEPAKQEAMSEEKPLKPSGALLRKTSLKLKAEGLTPQQLVESGQKMLSQQRVKDARYFFEKAEAEGSLEAALTLGKMDLFVAESKEEVREALALIKRAAEEGSSEVCGEAARLIYNLCRQGFLDQSLFDQSLQWLQTSAGKGDPRSKVFWLNYCYQYPSDDRVKTKAKEEIIGLEKAGQRNANLIVAEWHLQNGKVKEAQELLNLLVEDEMPEAMIVLATHLSKGLTSTLTAEQLLEQAIKLGSSEAAYLLGMAKLTGNKELDIKKFASAGMENLRKAQYWGHALAIRELASAYENGIAGKKNPTKARALNSILENLKL